MTLSIHHPTVAALTFICWFIDDDVYVLFILTSISDTFQKYLLIIIECLL